MIILATAADMGMSRAAIGYTVLGAVVGLIVVIVVASRAARRAAHHDGASRTARKNTYNGR